MHFGGRREGRRIGRRLKGGVEVNALPPPCAHVSMQGDCREVLSAKFRNIGVNQIGLLQNKLGKNVGWCYFLKFIFFLIYLI